MEPNFSKISQSAASHKMKADLFLLDYALMAVLLGVAAAAMMTIGLGLGSALHAFIEML